MEDNMNNDNSNMLSLSFDYNGSVPIFNNNNEISGYGYLKDDYEKYIGVAFISYTTTTNDVETYHYLGTPHKHGQGEYHKLDDIGVRFDVEDGKFVMDFKNEKLVAETYKDTNTIIKILSLDIVCGDQYSAYIYHQDAFEFNTSIEYTNLIGLLDDDHNDVINYYTGGISLRVNDDGEFHYMNLPTSYNEAADMYSFLKYDNENSVLLYDASHLEYYYDRYLLSYDEIRHQLEELDSSYIDSGLASDLSSYHQGEITVDDGDNTIKTFSYYLDYSKGFNKFELIVIDEDGVKYPDGFFMTIKDSDKASVTITGLEIVNVNYEAPKYSIDGEQCSGIAIICFDGVEYGFEDGQFMGPYTRYVYEHEVNGETHYNIVPVNGTKISDNTVYAITSSNSLHIAFDYNGDFYGYKNNIDGSYSDELKSLLK